MTNMTTKAIRAKKVKVDELVNTKSFAQVIEERLDGADEDTQKAIKGNPFAEFVLRYKYDPVMFVKEVLNVQPDQWRWSS